MKIWILLIASLLQGLPAFAQTGQERILSFDSRITVQKDSTQTVQETIRVTAAGKSIRHGIYRDFPTRYRDKYGNRYVVGFRVLSVSRDGSPEDYRVEPSFGNGQRVYIGSKNSLVPPGEHAYVLTYETHRQIGFFKDHDELYWNVTGNGWDFPIDQASALVVLPPEAAGRVLSKEAYTGPQGARGRDYEASTDPEGNSAFRSTRPFRPHEGLTIVVAWPKGIIQEPDARTKWNYVIQDNADALAGGIGLLIVLAFYLGVKLSVCRNPPEGTIVPLYEPPAGMSPAEIRYLSRKGYDGKAFAADVVDMAVKGFLTIKEDGGKFSIEKKTPPSNMTPDEALAGNILLPGSRGSLDFLQAQHATIESAVDHLKKYLKERYQGSHFNTNRGYFATGVALSAAVLIVAGTQNSNPKALAFLGFIGLWLSIWSLGVAGLIYSAYTAWKSVFSGQQILSSGFQAIFLSAFSLPFLAGEGLGFYLLAKQTSAFVAALVLLLVIVNALFSRLLKNYTVEGRELMDRIDGFKMFLAATEQDRLNTLYPGTKTPALFEKFMPYAMALGVEQAWADQFADILNRAGQAPYHPTWYSGGRWTNNLGSFSSALGSSMAGAIASASTSPGSSSGGGGGGSSGGGGGGGGGGGW